MKRQTKKGPRRSRAMPVVGCMVTTEYRGTAYLTAGKVYRAKHISKNVLTVVDNDGDEILIANPNAPFTCPHIGENHWSWVTL